MGVIIRVHGGPAPTTCPPGWVATSETDIADVLDRHEVDVVIVARSASRPVEVLQRVHALAPEAQAIVEAQAADHDQGNLRRELRYAPGLPAGIRILAAGDDAGAAASAAQDQAHRGRRYAALVTTLRSQLAAPHAATDPPAHNATGALLGHAPLGVVVADGAGLITTWNDKAAEMLALGPDAAGGALASLFTDPSTVAAALAQAVSSLEIVAEVRADTPGDTGRAFELTFAPTRSESDNPLVLGLLVDVTARRRAEHARDELSERLAASGRAQAFLLEAWDAIAHTVSYAETLAALASVAVPALGDLCLIDVVDETGRQQRMVVRHASPSLQSVAAELCRYPPAPGGPHPIVGAIDDGRSRWSPAVNDEFLRATSRDEEHFRLLKRLGFSGFITVPLQAGERILGTVTLISCGDRHFELADLHLAEALADRVASVVDKARLYDREHLIAVSLQRAMQTALPDLGVLQTAARYLPSRADSEVGGDWYDVFRLPAGGTGVAIGDVVGHDLAAATRMGQLRNLLRGLAFDREESPGEILGRLDRLNDGLGVAELATVIYGTLEHSPGGQALFRWANAGHLPPIHITPGGRTRLLDGNLGAAIGMPGGSSRPEAAATIEAGSTLLLYTDGLVESRADQLDKGIDALLQHCADHATQSLDDLTDGILAALASQAEDDVALLAFRLAAPDPE